MCPLPTPPEPEDQFILSLYSPMRALERGFEGVARILEVFESLNEELRPDIISHTRRVRRYSRQVLLRRLHEAFGGNGKGIRLVRSEPPSVVLSLEGWGATPHAHSCVTLTVEPFSFFREPERAEARAAQLLSFVRALAECLPLAYGMGHSQTDVELGRERLPPDLRALTRPQEAYWLNVYGPDLVEQLGRERLLTVPHAHLEELPGGAVLWLTQPTPGDFNSEEAREAQARALCHLRPELSPMATLATLRRRSQAFEPVPMRFHEEVADILQWEVELRGLAHRRQEVERFNRYRPPPVTECLPAEHAPASDVEDGQAAIHTYEGLFAEQLVLLLQHEVPQLKEDALEALPRVDFHLWHYGWGRKMTAEQRDLLVPALGAWLGCLLVRRLGGRWVPRRTLEETAVVVGDRAWLPFLRARHALMGQHAPLHHSCSQLFRVAERLARGHASESRQPTG